MSTCYSMAPKTASTPITMTTLPISSISQIYEPGTTAFFVDDNLQYAPVNIPTSFITKIDSWCKYSNYPCPKMQ